MLQRSRFEEPRQLGELISVTPIEVRRTAPALDLIFLVVLKLSLSVSLIYASPGFALEAIEQPNALGAAIKVTQLIALGAAIY